MNRDGIVNLRALVVLGCVLLAATSAHAVTDLEKFEKKLGKIAAIQPGGGIPGKPAGFCSCVSGAYALHTGYLRQFRFTNYVRIQCVTPLFDAAGAQSGFGSCDEWIPLSK
jgi:hypothetical protein